MSKLAISEALFAFTFDLAQHGRTDYHSRLNMPSGKGYQFADSGVSTRAIADHLSSEQPIAIYLFHGEATHLAAFDIDSHGGELSWEQMVAKSGPLVDELERRGIPTLVVRSGGGAGIHIWMIWRKPQKVRDVRRFLKRLLRKHGLKPGTGGLAEGTVEIYPKQDRVPDGKVGNPIALPFARRSLPLDRHLQPISLEEYLPPDLVSLYVGDVDTLPTEGLPDEPGKPSQHAKSGQSHDVQLGDEAEAHSALRHVRADDYDGWVRIGLILKHCFGEGGFGMWSNWSRTSTKYPGRAECREKWDSFDPDGSLSIGSLFQMAQQGGWNGPSHPEIREMNAKYGIVTQGSKTMIVEKRIDADEDSPLVWITKEVLRDRYRWKKIAVTRGEDVEQVSVVDLWLASRNADQYRKVDFNPNLKPGDNGAVYNLWTGFAVSPEPGDWSLLRDHIAHNVCGEDPELYEWLLNWLALGVQQPGLVIGTAPVLSGLPGTGKGVLAHTYGSLWGRHYTSITQESHVAGRFNAHLFGRRFIFIDEGIWGGNRPDAGTIKTRVTEPYIMIEAKGVDPIRVRNRTIYMISSNEASIVPADIADRRWQILDVGDRNREDHRYFSALVNQLDSGGRQGLLYDLLERDLSAGPDPRRTIKTAGLFEQILRAQGPEFRYVFQLLDDGQLPQPEAPNNRPNATTIGAMHADLRAKHPGGQYVQPRNFGKYLRGIFPTIETVQSGTYLERSGGQVISQRSTRYHFPPLLQCRRDFERFVAQKVPWSNDVQDWQSGGVASEIEPPF